MTETITNNAQTIIDEMITKDPEMISKLAHNITKGALKACTPATKILTLASILVCWLQKYDLSYANALGLADCLVHRGDFNNISKEFQDIYEDTKEG